MKQFTINFANVKTLFGFYDAIIAGLELPDWCGKNSSAIWDMLTGYLEYPVTIRIHGASLLPKEYEDEMDLLMKIFQRAEDRYDDIKITIKIIS